MALVMDHGPDHIGSVDLFRGPKMLYAEVNTKAEIENGSIREQHKNGLTCVFLGP